MMLLTLRHFQQAIGRTGEYGFIATKFAGRGKRAAMTLLDHKRMNNVRGLANTLRLNIGL